MFATFCVLPYYIEFVFIIVKTGDTGDATGDAETQENFLKRKFSRTLSKNLQADHGSTVLTRGISAEPKL